MQTKALKTASTGSVVKSAAAKQTLQKQVQQAKTTVSKQSAATRANLSGKFKVS